MNNKLTVTINQTELPVKEYQGQRVVTMKEIDAVHQRPEGTARRNFNANKHRFIEGVDYFVRTASEAAEEFGIIAPSNLTLITETGYLMLVKLFKDDLAWTVQRQLVNVYFRTSPEDRREAAKQTAQAPKRPALSSVNGAVKLILGTMEEAGVAPEYRVLALKGIYEPYGLPVPTEGLPAVEKLYDLTTMAEELGVMSAKSGKPHAQAVGAILGLVGVMEAEVKVVPFIHNGHSGTTEQYAESVLKRVHKWLEVNGWPTTIKSVGGTKYKVRYDREAR